MRFFNFVTFIVLAVLKLKISFIGLALQCLVQMGQFLPSAVVTVIMQRTLKKHAVLDIF